MKELSLLTWLTQLGLSVAVPLGGFVMLALWLRGSFGWGSWVIWVGLALGLWGAVSGFIRSLKLMDRLSRGPPERDDPPTAFNEHI